MRDGRAMILLQVLDEGVHAPCHVAPVARWARVGPMAALCLVRLRGLVCRDLKGKQCCTLAARQRRGALGVWSLSRSELQPSLCKGGRVKQRLDRLPTLCRCETCPQGQAPELRSEHSTVGDMKLTSVHPMRWYLQGFCKDTASCSKARLRMVPSFSRHVGQCFFSFGLHAAQTMWPFAHCTGVGGAA